jgi:hypothetical protein
MKRSSLALLFAAVSGGALIAACSSSVDDGGGGPLSRGGYYTNPSAGGGSSSGATSSSGSTGTSSGSSPSGSSSGAASGSSSGGSGSGGGIPVAPAPDAGPGSTSSPAHVYFDATVFPDLAVCQACHSSGVDGAPKMMVAPADNAYSELDALGLIQSNSLLLTKGSHDTGKAPALTTQQQSDITTWLGMEAQERAGTAAPTNVLAQVAKCVSQADFNAIQWSNLVTQPRTTENPNKCTGCNQARCVSCHEGGEYGFDMAEGSTLYPAGTTFKTTFEGPNSSSYITKYFGLNGTAPVASNAILLKMQAVAAGPAYSHPMFTMSTTMQTALNTFVNNAITNYTNNTCTGLGASDAGLGGD